MMHLRHFFAAAALIGAVGASACSSTTDSSAAAISTITLTDNPASTQSTGTSSGSNGTYSGTLTGTAQAQISIDGTTWSNVGSPMNLNVALQSTTSQSQFTINTTVPVGTYAYVRLVFDPGATATVSGFVNGTMYNNASVSLGGGSSFVIERAVSPRMLHAGSSAAIAWDFNSEVWLTSSTLQAHAVSSAAVQTASWATLQ